MHLNSTFDTRSVTRDCVYMSLALLFGREVIVQFHGGDPHRVLPFKLPVLRAGLGRLLAAARCVLTLSRLQTQQLLAVLPALQRVQQVANFIALSTPAPKQLADCGPVKFLFLSRLHADKGIRSILDAVRQLQREGCALTLNVCGDGPERAWLQAEIQASDVKDCVTYSGVVQGREKARALAEADVMLLPTRHNEGFPFTLLEAMAAGLPMIATRAGAIPEVVADGVNGLLLPASNTVALADAMRALILDRSRIRAMSRAARAMVEANYSLDSMHTVFSTLYGAAAGEAINGRPSSVPR